MSLSLLSELSLTAPVALTRPTQAATHTDKQEAVRNLIVLGT